MPQDTRVNGNGEKLFVHSEHSAIQIYRDIVLYRFPTKNSELRFG